MSSYFQAIRRLKDSNFYINAISSQFALWKATQDQVDNPIYKAYSRATTNRLICRELAETPVQRDAEFYQPGIPAEPGPVGPSGGTVTVMINFDHELEDRSTFKNHALHEFTNQQLLFTEGKDTGLSFAVNFNPASNSTYDKLWIPFSPSTQILYDTPNGFSIFTRIMPLITDDLGSVSSQPGPAPQTNRIKYYGGLIPNKYNMQVWNIWWGNEWTDTSTPHFAGGNINAASVKSRSIQCIDAIANSEYFDALWSNGWPTGFKRMTTHHVNHTSTSLPGSFGSNVTLANVEQVIRNCVSAGLVPNYDTFGEPITDKDGNVITGPGGGSFDYRHIYFVHMPPSRRNISGGAGFAYTAVTPPSGTVWYMYNGSEVYPSYTSPTVGTITGGQAMGSLWAHEIFHHLEDNSFVGCEPPAGYLYSTSSEPCSSKMHCTTCGPTSAGGCGAQHVMLQGSGQPVASRYWSDMDGKCVAPGSGESWVHLPTPTTPTGPITRRYIFQKLDDLDNGATAAIGSSGTVFFNVKKAGVEYKVKTAAGAVIVDQWADIWFTFDSTANQAKIFVNNVMYNTASTEVLKWNNTHSHTIIANHNMGATIGQFRGRMDDFRLYRSAVVDSVDVDNLNNNGLTVTGIENTSEQGVFIVNRVKIDKKLDNTSVYVPGDADSDDVPAATESFTDTSFSSSSFTL